MKPVTAIVSGRAKSTVAELGNDVTTLKSGAVLPFGDIVTLIAFTTLRVIIAGRRMTAVMNAVVVNTERHLSTLVTVLMASIAVTNAASDPQTPGHMNA